MKENEAVKEMGNESDESMICMDLKGKLRSEIYKIAKLHNYIVRELNIDDVSTAYDPDKVVEKLEERSKEI